MVGYFLPAWRASAVTRQDGQAVCSSDAIPLDQRTVFIEPPGCSYLHDPVLYRDERKQRSQILLLARPSLIIQISMPPASHSD